ncbi:MAG: hypothetical protein JWP02_190, partial [Acidimicrobiales bacterium]|nr:hypothetical protein [Acidimicrobiales bacterium]
MSPGRVGCQPSSFSVGALDVGLSSETASVNGARSPGPDCEPGAPITESFGYYT